MIITAWKGIEEYHKIFHFLFDSEILIEEKERYERKIVTFIDESLMINISESECYDNLVILYGLIEIIPNNLDKQISDPLKTDKIIAILVVANGQGRLAVT